MEYYLLPTDVDPNKTDITLFGIAAKIYPEKQDAKVMKTWTEGNKTWIAWAQRYKVTLVPPLLLILTRTTAHMTNVCENLTVATSLQVISSHPAGVILY